ncbi:hypothetical protein C8T65DRAFT_693570 [Cerioporus squamosus]|nr:hypothetical protein C8T65DRAFT_693570 [Cerioporus squamosus]
MIPELRKHKLAFTIGHEHFGNDENLAYELVHEHPIKHLTLHVLTPPSDPRTSGNTNTDLGDGQSLPSQDMNSAAEGCQVLSQERSQWVQYHPLALEGFTHGEAFPRQEPLAPLHQHQAYFLVSPALQRHTSAAASLQCYSRFVKMKHSSISYFECQENACPPCISCGHGCHPSSPAALVTPPPLPVSQIHHHSPASTANVNPSSTYHRCMGSVSMPTAMSFAQPQLAETGLTPAVTTMALMSGHIRVVPLPASATIPPLNHSSDDSDYDLLPNVSAADLVSQVNHETGRSAPRETQKIQSAYSHAPPAVIPATSSVDNGPLLIPIAPPASQATMQDWCDILTELADANTVSKTLKFYGNNLNLVTQALQAYLVYLAATASSKEGKVLMWTLPAHIQKFSEFVTITEVMSTQARLYRMQVPYFASVLQLMRNK